MKAVFRFIWGAMRAFNTIAGVILFVLIFVFIAGISQLSREKPPAHIADNSIFLFDPAGALVEQRRAAQFLDVFDGKALAEVLLHEALETIDRAAKDDRISMMVVNFDKLTSAGPASLHSMGKAIEDFRQTGKTVIGTGDNFGQWQYFLAAHADEVWLNAAGAVTVSGLGAYGPFFAEALDKLKANVHVFRVGTYKSAVEPFIRDSMSDEAKEANRAFLNTLWDSYIADVTRLRGLEEGAMEEALANLPDRLEASGGDLAQMALDLGWVDRLMTRSEMQEALAEMQGAKDPESLTQVAFKPYVKSVRSTQRADKTPAVAVLTLRGNIIPGKAPPEQIGADSAVELINTARTDDTVKALVVRVDSPGGSAFASEVIRQALKDVQDSGKPVIASFGSVAASGGYWISATSDEIWAMPETITGSIGIFGLFMTFEDTLDSIGIHVDGVGTSPLAGAFDPTRPLSPMVASLIQSSVEDGYEKFLKLVADGRDMTVEEVDKVAQGRVWAGSTALELGLVDQLGDLKDAVKSAAKMAGLEEDAYRVHRLRPELDPFEKILADIAEGQQAWGKIPFQRKATSRTAIDGLMTPITSALETVSMMNDPNGTFVLCLQCEVR